MTPSAPEKPVHSETFPFVCPAAFRESTRKQAELICRTAGVKIRLLETQGQHSSFFIAHLRGERPSIAVAKNDLLTFLGALPLMSERKQWPRPLRMVIAFAVGALFSIALLWAFS